MKYDLNVARILNICHTRTESWKRHRRFPRGREALVLFLEGEIDYRFEDKTVTARGGDLLLLPGELAYDGARKTKRVDFYVVDFTCGEGDGLSSLGAPMAVRLQDAEAMRRSFEEALHAWESQRVGAQMALKSFVYGVLGGLVDRTATGERAEAESEVLRYIRGRLEDPSLTVKELCERFFLSESQLRRNLVRATGHAPNEYITLLRINRARGLLLETDLQVKEIAARCGFSSAYYFSRCFTAQAGASPREFRRRYGESDQSN